MSITVPHSREYRGQYIHYGGYDHLLYDLETEFPHSSDDRPVDWQIIYADPPPDADRSSLPPVVSSWEMTWNEQAQMQLVDGILLPLSHRKIEHLVVIPPTGKAKVLFPPKPVEMFAFTRYGVPVGAPDFSPTTPPAYWLYTLFGYLYDQSRILLVINDDSSVRLLQQSRSRAYML